MGNNNPLLRTSLFRSNALTAIAAGLLSLLLTSLRMRLWHFDLAVPVVYSGDALYFNVMVKALTEGTWNYHIARLGAPFGMDAVDFPIGCTLDFAVIKVLTAIIHDPFLSVNLYWLLTIAMAGGFAALFFRSLQISHLASASFGALFAIIPFVFYRNISHLNLVQFIVPPAAYLGIDLARGRVFGISQSHRPSEKQSNPLRILLVRFAICAAIGLTYIYWAFFACIVIAVGCLIGLCRVGNKKIVFVALLYVTVIGTVSVAEKSGSLLYWYRNGYNRALSYKTPAEADIYGLRIRQMLTPIQNHSLPLMRSVRDKIVSAFPNDDANESSNAALGTIGVVGFLILIYVAVGRPRGRILGDARLELFSGFVVAFVLIACVGGFGSLFNIFVVHEFRAYNRISPFIALFSLAAAAISVSAFLAGKKSHFRWLVYGCMLIFAGFDQIDLVEFSNRENETRRFYEEQFFIRQLEDGLPVSTMVFQLPHTDFPLDPGRGRMPPFDQARAYLHSKTLRWSWGAMSHRHDNWTSLTAQLPLSEFVEHLIFAGFGGLLIDRYGYKDAEFEQSVLSYLGPDAKFDLGGRWVFFDLRDFRDKLESSLSSEERARREEAAKHPTNVDADLAYGTKISFGIGGKSEPLRVSGWSGTEQKFTWTEGTSAVLAMRVSPTNDLVVLKMKLAGLTKNPELPFQPVEVYVNDQKVADWHVAEAAVFSAAIPQEMTKRGGLLRITLKIPKAASPKALGLSADPRVLGISCFNLQPVKVR